MSTHDPAAVGGDGPFSVSLVPMMEFAFLADKPTAIAKVAIWYFDEWGYTRPGQSVISTSDGLKAYLNRDRAPLIVLAVEEQEVIGAAQLKFREMDIYPEREHWLGGVFVDPRYRGKGLGSMLANRIVAIARELKIKALYLQTMRLDGGLYASLGWQPRERVRSSVGEVVVMENVYDANLTRSSRPLQPLANSRFLEAHGGQRLVQARWSSPSPC